MGDAVGGGGESWETLIWLGGRDSVGVLLWREICDWRDTVGDL